MQSSFINGRSFVVAFIGLSAAGYFACAPSSSGVSSEDGNGGPGSGGDGTGDTNGGKTGGKGGNAFDGGVGTGGSPFIIEFADALTMGTGGNGQPNNESPVDALEACGMQTFAVKREPPEVMLVLDRSGSMMRTVDGKNPSSDNTVPAGTPRRWQYARDAISAVLQATEADVQWGLKLYPTCKHDPKWMSAMPVKSNFNCELPFGTHNPCAVDGLSVSPELDQSAEVISTINGNTPVIDTGATPTAAAVKKALETLKASNTPNPKYILLATDGIPNCGLKDGKPSDSVADPDGAVASVMAATDAGVPVFVLGIAIDDPTNLPANDTNLMAHMTLNRMASAGGRPRDGDVKYYPALNMQMLLEALSAIAASTIPCVMPLEMPPQDDAIVTVDVDGKRLPESEADGWSFTPGKKALRFNGAACTKLQKGEFKNTEISFHCPGKPLPPPPPPAL